MQVSEMNRAGRVKVEGNLIFCCMGTWKNYIGSVGWHNNNNPKFQVSMSKNKNIDH